jgi:hypothetical protein
MSRQVAVKGASVTLLVAFCALVLLVAMSPREFVHDEPAYVNYVPLLRHHGLTEKFLDELTGAAGPLYAFVHLALSPLTDLRPVEMRLVNVVFLLVVVAILAAWFRRQSCSDYAIAAGSIIIMPLTWVITGMALTTMPALLFATLSLYLQLRGVEALDRGGRVLAWFVAGSFCLGAAVWGRQPYLVLAGVPVLLSLLDRRMRIPAMVFAGIVMVMIVPLVIAWEGLVPPLDEVDEGLAPSHGLISLGYAGICFFLLAPQPRWLLRKRLIAAAVVIALINGMFGIVVSQPLESVVDDFLPESAMSLYGVLCGSMLLACGCLFLAWLLRVTWQRRDDLKLVTINVSLLFVVLSPTFIGNYYSSRYTAMALPYLVLAAQPWRKWEWKTNIVAIAGCGIGLLALYGYFWEA